MKGGKAMAKNTSYAYSKFEKLCSEKNLTPYQVAKNSHNRISTAVLSQWKNNEYALKLDKLTVIAEVFGVPVTEFIELGG